MNGNFPRFERSKEIPKPANTNIEIDKEALPPLDEVAKIVRDIKPKIEQKIEAYQWRLSRARDYKDREGENQVSELMAAVTAFENSFRAIERRREELLAEPDDKTAEDSRELYDRTQTLLTEYETHFGE